MKQARVLGGIVVIVAVLSAAAFYFAGNNRAATDRSLSVDAKVPDYVGAATCAGCHATEVSAWKGSHHDLAMQHATPQSVLGNFDNVSYEYNGVATRFSKRAGRYFVNTDGADGKLADFEVRYTFGVAPLQQYLIEFPGGRMQALGVAWDSRSKGEGGQHWFHLYPKEKVDYKDELHWTKRSQNWNYMCAECHSTNLKKNYDLAANAFTTKWSEINVACESCHGPASQHLDWANKKAGAEHYDRKGLVFMLNERQGAAWVREAAAKTATRTPPRVTTIEIDTCARCHSRRSMLSENYQHGKPLMDTHLPVLLTQPLYYPDGQINDEDFEYGSFLQSKMFHQGVTCGDCHEPHSLKLRAPGNQTCLQCHSADTYNNKKHHFHEMEGKGAICADCHMPTTNFMVVHARHDHSIRIPRPDLSVKLQTPNACNHCHVNKTPAWATAQMTQWYGKEWLSGWHFGETLLDAQQGKPVGQDLVAVAASPQIADIARATAAALLPNYLDPTVGVVLPRLLSDKSAMVRRAALATVEAVPPQERLRLAANLLTDPVLAVRIEAARILSALPRESLALQQQQALDKGVREYIDVALANADHPQSHVNLGLLYLGQGLSDKSEQAYLQAIKLDPAYAVAYVNLADLYRLQQREDKAENILVAARVAVGEDAGVEHALGLQYVRAKQMPQALVALANAVRLQSDNARYGYVYAVALESNGAIAHAINVLEAVHAKHPNDRDVLIGLVSFLQARGNSKAAMGYARKLAEMDPRYGSPQQILEQVAR